jgi:predicted transcriptional regulator of viral defense system
MIYKTKDLINSGETEYSIREKVLKKKLFLIDYGIYSDEEDTFLDEIFICKKYPQAIITGFSAFYYYDLTDNIPNKFYLATKQHSYPIRNENVSQSYQDKEYLLIGKTTINSAGGTINIYDLERVLIELVRLKEKYPPELYYEVLNSFRLIKDNLDFYKLNSYLRKFKNGHSLSKKIKEII